MILLSFCLSVRYGTICVFVDLSMQKKQSGFTGSATQGFAFWAETRSGLPSHQGKSCVVFLVPNHNGASTYHNPGKVSMVPFLLQRKSTLDKKVSYFSYQILNYLFTINSYKENKKHKVNAKLKIFFDFAFYEIKI